MAKLAKVSAKTVSRLNESHLVAESTRQRVLEAIAKLDYHPNVIAASLKRNRSNMIGFVVPYGRILCFRSEYDGTRGTHDHVSAAGFELIVSVLRHKEDALQEALRSRKTGMWMG